MQVSAGTGGIFDFVLNVHISFDTITIFNCVQHNLQTKSLVNMESTICSVWKQKPSFLPSILNQLQQIGETKPQPRPFTQTLIWNECEIIFLFGPALPWSCMFLFTVTSMARTLLILCPCSNTYDGLSSVSLSPCWLLWAVCLSGCQWSWSGRQTAVGDDVCFRKCVMGWILSACLPDLRLSPWMSGFLPAYWSWSSQSTIVYTASFDLSY